jgi:hypothetical protein
MTDDRWPMADDQWLMADGRWPMVAGWRASKEWIAAIGFRLIQL